MEKNIYIAILFIFVAVVVARNIMALIVDRIMDWIDRRRIDRDISRRSRGKKKNQPFHGEFIVIHIENVGKTLRDIYYLAEELREMGLEVYLNSDPEGHPRDMCMWSFAIVADSEGISFGNYTKGTGVDRGFWNWVPIYSGDDSARVLQESIARGKIFEKLRECGGQKKVRCRPLKKIFERGICAMRRMASIQ